MYVSAFRIMNGETCASGVKMSCLGMFAVSTNSSFGRVVWSTTSVAPRILPLKVRVMPPCHDSWHWFDGRMQGSSGQIVSPTVSYVPMENVSHGGVRCALIKVERLYDPPSVPPLLALISAIHSSSCVMTIPCNASECV